MNLKETINNSTCRWVFKAPSSVVFDDNFEIIKDICFMRSTMFHFNKPELVLPVGVMWIPFNRYAYKHYKETKYVLYCGARCSHKKFYLEED